MNLVNVVLIDNHLHHCTIVNRDFVIRLRNENEGVWPRLSYENCIVHSWFVWMLWTREEVSLNDSAGIRDSWTRTRDGGRKWVWTTRLAFAICERERGAEGGSESEWLTEWFTATGNTTERTNEQTNERTNDSFWWTERRELIRGKESWNPPLLDYECDARLRHPCSLFNTIRATMASRKRCQVWLHFSKTDAASARCNTGHTNLNIVQKFIYFN